MNNTEAGNIIEIEEITLHSDYNPRFPYNDIALVRIQGSFE